MNDLIDAINSTSSKHFISLLKKQQKNIENKYQNINLNKNINLF